MLRIAKVIDRTTAEGPHERMALWVSGCDLACPGCCNPELFGPDAGPLLQTAELLDLLDRGVSEGIEGISVLGGEPLQQMPGLHTLLAEARARGLGTIVFTGYLLAQAHTLVGFADLLPNIDTLIDGPFDARQPEQRRRFIGSANQTLHHQTPRYADPGLWRGPTRIEVRIDANGDVEAHGLPLSVSRIARRLRTV